PSRARQVADDLFQAAPDVGFLLLRIAIEQDGGEGERRHHQAGAEQEKQQRDAEAGPAFWPYLASALHHPVAPRLSALVASAEPPHAAISPYCHDDRSTERTANRHPAAVCRG